MKTSGQTCALPVSSPLSSQLHLSGLGLTVSKLSTDVLLWVFFDTLQLLPATFANQIKHIASDCMRQVHMGHSLNTVQNIRLSTGDILWVRFSSSWLPSPGFPLLPGMLRFQPISFLGQTNSFSLSKYSLTRKWGSGIVGIPVHRALSALPGCPVCPGAGSSAPAVEQNQLLVKQGVFFPFPPVTETGWKQRLER